MSERIGSRTVYRTPKSQPLMPIRPDSGQIVPDHSKPHVRMDVRLGFELQRNPAKSLPVAPNSAPEVVPDPTMLERTCSLIVEKVQQAVDFVSLRLTGESKES